MARKKMASVDSRLTKLEKAVSTLIERIDVSQAQFLNSVNRNMERIVDQVAGPAVNAFNQSANVISSLDADRASRRSIEQEIIAASKVIAEFKNFLDGAKFASRMTSSEHD